MAGLLLLRQGGAVGGWKEKVKALSGNDPHPSAKLQEDLEHLQRLASNFVGHCYSIARH